LKIASRSSDKKNMAEPGTTCRLQTSLLLSMIVHVGFLALAGSWTRHVLVDGGRLSSAGSVMMLEWVDAPEPAPAPPPVPSTEESLSVPEVSSSIKEVETSEAAPPKPGSPEGDRGRNAAPGKRLNIDSARMAWIRDVFARTLTYQRNAPKGFEAMVRSALSLHPSSAEGSAKISFRFDPSGTVNGVDIRSDSPELKTALGRVGWEAGPLPTRYQIPCSGLNVNVTVTGPNLSVGIEIL
jgi:hypothetical protein